MWDWIKFLAVVAALIVGAVVLVKEMHECRAKGGVLVQYACVRTI